MEENGLLKLTVSCARGNFNLGDVPNALSQKIYVTFGRNRRFLSDLHYVSVLEVPPLLTLLELNLRCS
jgi:hypothetical protein